MTPHADNSISSPTSRRRPPPLNSSIAGQQTPSLPEGRRIKLQCSVWSQFKLTRPFLPFPIVKKHRVLLSSVHVRIAIHHAAHQFVRLPKRRLVQVPLAPERCPQHRRHRRLHATTRCEMRPRRASRRRQCGCTCAACFLNLKKKKNIHPRADIIYRMPPSQLVRQYNPS